MDAFRWIFALIGCADLLMFPSALRVYERPARSIILVLAVNLLIISAVGRLLSHLHQHVVPYGLPLIGPALVALFIYCVRAILNEQQGRSINE